MGAERSGAEAFAAAIVELERELDWDRLGVLYCHEGGESFFPPAQIDALREAGFLLASGLLEHLEPLDSPGLGRSLYVGPALAELAPILAELLVAKREVVLVNLPGAEIVELERALAAVGSRLGLELPRFHLDGFSRVDGPFDHAWMTSVLTDPDAFPALHDRLYGRTGDDATGRGDAKAETRAAHALCGEMVERIAPPALFTTTDEELEFVGAACATRGWRLEIPRRAALSAIVGDALRHCRVIREPDSLADASSS